MHFEFRRDYLEDENHILPLAEIDMTIPPLYDPLFKVDENRIRERARILKECYQGKNYFEVALDTRKLLAGYHGLRIEDYFGVKIGVIDTLWVAPIYRQLGLATQLKERAENWAREQGLDHITTWVHADNKTMIEINKTQGYKIAHYKFKKKL